MDADKQLYFLRNLSLMIEQVKDSDDQELRDLQFQLIQQMIDYQIAILILQEDHI